MSNIDPTQLQPESPRAEGLDPSDPPLVDVEPVHLLANEVRDRLRKAGFDDTQIDDWSRAYFVEHTGGTASDFLAWIAAQEEVVLDID